MKSLLVVGSLHWDIVVNAPHIPGCDETVLGHSVNYVFGGKGGNQAVAADQNGAMTYFTGRIGKDQFGMQLSLIHISSPRDLSTSRMPSSA